MKTRKCLIKLAILSCATFSFHFAQNLNNTLATLETNVFKNNANYQNCEQESTDEDPSDTKSINFKTSPSCKKGQKDNQTFNKTSPFNLGCNNKANLNLSNIRNLDTKIFKNDINYSNTQPSKKVNSENKNSPVTFFVRDNVVIFPKKVSLESDQNFQKAVDIFTQELSELFSRYENICQQKKFIPTKNLMFQSYTFKEIFPFINSIYQAISSLYALQNLKNVQKKADSIMDDLRNQKYKAYPDLSIHINNISNAINEIIQSNNVQNNVKIIKSETEELECLLNKDLNDMVNVLIEIFRSSITNDENLSKDICMSDICMSIENLFAIIKNKDSLINKLKNFFYTIDKRYNNAERRPLFDQLTDYLYEQLDNFIAEDIDVLKSISNFYISKYGNAIDNANNIEELISSAVGAYIRNYQYALYRSSSKLSKDKPIKSTITESSEDEPIKSAIAIPAHLSKNLKNNLDKILISLFNNPTPADIATSSTTT